MLNKQFTATLQKSPNKGGWTYVAMPDSVEFFGTRRLVKARGRIDGHPFRSSLIEDPPSPHRLKEWLDTFFSSLWTCKTTLPLLLRTTLPFSWKIRQAPPLFNETVGIEIG